MNNSQKLFRDIAKKGSKTYFNSSIFFPKSVRDDVFTLYSFVRTADDFVDTIPQNKAGFNKFVKDFNSAYKTGNSQNIVLHEFVKLMKKRKFEKKWVDDFLKTMKMDTTRTTYKTIHDTQTYMYGSAEVVGLMMAKILKLPKKSYPYAKLLGRSMQYINFLRDVQEDNMLGRLYVPKSSLSKYDLSTLSKKEAYQKKSQFIKLMRAEIDRYNAWQKEASIGFSYIPKRYLIPVKTASDMYAWTAQQIYKNPLVVYDKKVKPSKLRIFMQLAYNSITIW